MFDNYTVLENSNHQRKYFYGPLSDYEEEDFEDFNKIVSEDDYTCKDLVELFGDVLEDCNYHNLTSLGEDILEALNKTSISENDKVVILRTFMEKFLKQRGLS